MKFNTNTDTFLCVWYVYNYDTCIFTLYSLQFDPAPRRGEPLVTRRIPDYFM